MSLFEMPLDLSSELYGDILDDTYLQEIFSDVFFNYALNVLRIDRVLAKNINISDAVQFADLLSKADGVDNAMFLRLRGQELIILLGILYPNNYLVRQCLGNVLTTLGNYRGLDTSNSAYQSGDAYEEVYSLYEKNYLKIPNTEGSYFFRDQKNVYNRLDEKCLSFSGPTSMGKSFLIQTYIKQQVLGGIKKNFAVVVPTKALINEVRTRFINDLKEDLQNTNYRIVVSSNDIVLQQDHNFIFVLTPERLLYLLQDFPQINIDFVFVDEAHKISAKDSRGTYYYKVISQLKLQNPNAVVVFASPNVPNPYIYLKLISHELTFEKHEIISQYTPVCQYRFFVDLIDKKTFYFNPLTQQKIEVPNNDNINSLKELLSVVGKDKKSLVYCNAINKTFELAKEYADTLPNLDDEELDELARDIEQELHKDCYLVELIRKGIAYHVGYLPNSVRLRIERAFQNGLLNTIFCTSTLLEGVNLPADNLIVTDVKIGRRNLEEIDYLNLVGRVGRIRFNLYGNIILTRISEKTDVNKISELLITNSVPKQTISVEKEIKEKQKREIINCLVNNDITLKCCSKPGVSDNQIRLMRKFALILVHDITNNVESATLNAFKPYLSAKDEQHIKKHFDAYKDNHDISISFDQTSNIKRAIAEGLAYPKIIDGKVNYDELVVFLQKLKQIFMWDIYEKNKLGKGNAYKWYAVIISNWIQGKHINYILNESIEYKAKNRGNVYHGKRKEPYDGSQLHKNIVISDVLRAIESEILFGIASYFRRFSEEYKKFHNIKNFDNDWYQYIEYGTTNKFTIYLQQCGFSREVSSFIIRNKDRYVEQSSSGIIRLKSSLRDHNKIDVNMEANDVYYNQPDLFVV